MSQYPSQREYQKRCHRLLLEFCPTEAEAELWEWLSAQPKKATYIKRLIREDLEKLRQPSQLK